MKYAYVHNLQGDIVAILDSNGTAVVNYKYDAWGKPFTPTGSMATSLGELNPFRYRGYVYDEETGLYYLRSRYYDAYKCCFINADALINGNLYAYCENSPIVHEDNNGYALCCCLDDNGFETTLMSRFMYGGSCGGGSGSAVVGAAETFANGMESVAKLIDKTEKGLNAIADKLEEAFVNKLKDRDITYENEQVTNSIALYPHEMVLYAAYLQKNGYYEGTTAGFAFELLVHDIAYCYYYYKGDDENAYRAMHLDIGKTIYEDSHGWKTLVMLAAYQVLFPFQSSIDRYIDAFRK